MSMGVLPAELGGVRVLLGVLAGTWGFLREEVLCIPQQHKVEQLTCMKAYLVAQKPDI
jgi:hypothetical protein